MKHILYKLSMPNVGSWKGQWTGATNLYCVTRSYSKTSTIPKKVLSMKNYYYNFGDGWGVNINCSEITAKEKPKYQKASRGFYGYEWMVKEIEMFGRIKTLQERSQERAISKEAILGKL